VNPIYLVEIGPCVATGDSMLDYSLTYYTDIRRIKIHISNLCVNLIYK